MAKNRKPFMCGLCKHGYSSAGSTEQHIRASHPNQKVSIFQRVKEIDLRDDEPSFADRAVEAQIARNAGLPTDDAWLLGE